jgi:pentatricopeptide repeat protein
MATAYSVAMKALITKGDPRGAAAAFDQMLLAGYAPR